MDKYGVLITCADRIDNAIAVNGLNGQVDSNITGGA